jgi:hypothetical protein
MNTNNKQSEKWNEWFAGLTDGDGFFYINDRENSISFELTTHVTDSRVVYNIKNELKAGSVHLRSGSESVRYRVKKRAVIIDIANRLNGKLYNPVRLDQFLKVCERLNIKPLQSPALINEQSAYLAGLIDSYGSITIAVSRTSAADSQRTGVEGKTIKLINSRGYNQLSLRITSKYEENLISLQNSYGFGTIYKEQPNRQNRNPNAKYHWTIRSYEDFQKLYDYTRINPLKSVKMHRVRLSKLYFKYKQLGYHLKPSETIESKLWVKFCKSWFKYSF